MNWLISTSGPLVAIHQQALIYWWINRTPPKIIYCTQPFFNRVLEELDTKDSLIDGGDIVLIQVDTFELRLRATAAFWAQKQDFFVSGEDYEKSSGSKVR